MASLARDTVGRQLVRAVDSVGVNLVEGDGRHGGADAVHFFVIARASAREARYWIERAAARGIVEDEYGRATIGALTEATKLLNGLIGYRRAAASSVHDMCASYDADCDRRQEIVADSSGAE